MEQIANPIGTCEKGKKTREKIWLTYGVMIQFFNLIFKLLLFVSSTEKGSF